MRQAAFTLVELLVVITIIAILAAILFPVFAQSKAAAKQSACMSNLKQLGLGIELYRIDADEVSPIDADTGTLQGKFSLLSSYQIFPHAPLSSWVPIYPVLENILDPMSPVGADWAATGPAKGTLQPYVKNTQIFLCPVDPRPEKLLSYSLNGPVGEMPSSMTDRPSQFIELVDEETTLNDGFFFAPADCVSILHSGGGNLEFFDHHAKYYKPTIAVDLDNHCPRDLDMTLFCPTLPYEDGEYGPLCPAP